MCLNYLELLKNSKDPWGNTSCFPDLAHTQDIRAAVFRFFQEATSHAGTRLVAAAFDAGKRHQVSPAWITTGRRLEVWSSKGFRLCLGHMNTK